MLVVYSIIYFILSTLISSIYFGQKFEGPAELVPLFMLAALAMGFGIVIQPFMAVGIISFGGYLFLVITSIFLGAIFDFSKYLSL